MNIYSRALRHINIEDVKQKHQQKLIEQKNQEEKKEEEKYIASIMEEKKYEWRKEFEVIDNQIEEIFDDLIDKEYDWRQKLVKDRKRYFEEGMTSSETFFTTLEATGDTEYPILETNIVETGEDLYLYFDTRVYDTLVVDARVGEDISIFLTTAPLASFVDDDILIQIDTSGTYSFNVPQSQNFFFNFLKGVAPGGDPLGLAAIDAVRAKRTRPLNVFVSLDSPEAAAFIRTDPIMANLSPKERLKKLKEMLEASDEYVLKMLGADFPGTGAVLPGEAGDTPGVQMVNYQGKPITDPDDYWRNVTQVSPETFQQIYQQKVASGEITPSTTGVPWTQQQSSTTSSSSSQSSQSSTDQKPGSMYIQVGDKVIKKEYPGTQSQPSDTSDTSGRADPMAIMQALNIPFTDAVAAANRINDTNRSSQSQPSEPSEPSEPQQELTPEQLANIEASMKQLQLDNEKIKADANRRNWELAAELGMNALTAATLLSPIPGDEAIVIGARTASQTAKLARNFQRQNPGKYNPFLSDKANALARKQGVGTNVQGQNPAFRKPIIKNSYEPEGQLISEKKKLKSPQEVLDKIPGYYDGKPAPLGFPVEPPPKMVNGMHPDLVDGKKVADRFNRLDPVSAKAMPPTGNPHIDKKVRASAKKPK